MIRKTFLLDPKDYKKIQRLADEMDVSVNEFVRSTLIERERNERRDNEQKQIQDAVLLSVSSIRTDTARTRADIEQSLAAFLVDLKAENAQAAEAQHQKLVRFLQLLNEQITPVLEAINEAMAED